MIDCELLSKVYINLIDQKEPTLNLQNQDFKENNIIKEEISYFKKVVLPNQEEIQKHKSYLKKDLKKIILIKSFTIKFIKINFFLI